MTPNLRTIRSGLVGRVVWWGGFLVCAVFGAYALYLGLVEIVALLGVASEARPRAVPPVFVVHALTGGVALIGGALPLNRPLRRRRRLHRFVGRAYLWSTWFASVAGLWSAAFFQVNLAAKAAFGLLAILWFGTTTIGFRRIVAGRLAEHREWMLRSFSLAFFFVTSGVWMPALAATALPQAVGYPLSIFLGWILNLLVAEGWIRRTRPRTPQLPRPSPGRGRTPWDVGRAQRPVGGVHQVEPSP